MNNHPITPSPELIAQCIEMSMSKSGTRIEDVCRVAAQWGADQELEACSLLSERYGVFACEFHAARRAKPPSLKEQALDAIDNIERYGLPYIEESIKTIRTALEALNDN